MARYYSSQETFGGPSKVKNFFEVDIKGDFDKSTDDLLKHEFYNFCSKISSIVRFSLEKEQYEESLKEFKSVLGDCYKEIPNEYYRSEYAEPWYYFYTVKGPVKVGWRKRVINIDWSEFPNKNKASELFPNEDVTKGEYSIHAWGYEKFREYVKKIISSEK